jgi:hypothetical protein
VCISFTGCKKDNGETIPEVKKIKLGAQDNVTSGGFYSVNENSVYTLDQASQNQAVIDIFCFYDPDDGNNIAIAAPGTNITGIFFGPNSVENWTIKNITYFCRSTLDVDQFNALTETDQLIMTSFDQNNKFRRVKDLKVNDIYAFQIQSGIYGILKVTAVTRDTTGSVEFEIKIKK